ncbi:MAG: HAD family hydrolase [Spirochaetes bacterium]|nr:HAD family hydrolase [Spirochaetota bacterium]
MHPALTKAAFLCDMDGVIYHGNRLLPGIPRFLRFLQEAGKPYLFLTNSSERSPRELSQKLGRLGLEVDETHFYTSALATAAFLSSQKPGAGVYAIGEAGLVGALYEAGLTMNDVNPDYVVVGETRSYSYEKIEKAIHLVLGGARLIGANPDLTGPGEHGLSPACGALIAPIELSTSRKAYFVGKPNPLMMRQALKHLGVRREDTLMIGDRMDTDIIAGIESGIETCLVLTGVTTTAEVERFPYRPSHIAAGIEALVAELP